MSDTILIRGFTASDPALSTLPNGVPVVNFRLASTPRWQDATGTWKEGTTNWYTVKAYRRLAQNIATSIEKGQPLEPRRRHAGNHRGSGCPRHRSRPELRYEHLRPHRGEAHGQRGFRAGCASAGRNAAEYAALGRAVAGGASVHAAVCSGAERCVPGRRIPE